MAINIGDAVVKITGDTKELNTAMGSAQKSVDDSAKKMQSALKGTGIAFTAMGAAGLAIISSTKKINAELGVTALNLGITTEEMRDLTLATTNVTFPIKEVVATFDLLARAGVKDIKVLQDTANAFDTLADALGMSASQVTEIMIPAMKTFRLSAEEVAGKTDIMTYMVRNSTISLEDFNTMVGYTSQDMVDAGLTIDDMAAAMMYLSDSGVEPGKVMLREWNKAVTQSQDENISLTEALGMTSDELVTYKAGLEGATGITQTYADTANTQHTIMDKVKQKWSEVTLAASSFLEPLEPILAGMTALGPLMILLSTSIGTAVMKWMAHTAAVTASAIAHPIQTAGIIASKIAIIASTIAIKAITAAQWLWNAALAANPIGLVITAIGLLAAGIWALVSHIGTVKTKYDEWAEDFLTQTDSLISKVTDLYDTMATKARSDTKIKEAELEKQKVAVQEAYDKAIEKINEEYGVVVEATENKREEAESYYSDLKDMARDASEVEKDKAREASIAAISALDDEINKARSVYNEQIALINEVYGAKIAAVNEEAAAAIKAIQDQIDAIDAQAEAEKKAAQEAKDASAIATLEQRIANAETADEKARLTEELNALLLEIEKRRIAEQREAEKEALRDKQEDIRTAAQDEIARLAEELEGKKQHEADLLAETEGRIALEKTALDAALAAKLSDLDKNLATELGKLDEGLTEKLGMIETERLARLDAEDDKLKASLDNIKTELINADIILQNNLGIYELDKNRHALALEEKLLDAQAFVDEYNSIMSGLGLPEEVITPPEKKTPQQAQEEWIKDRDAWQKENPMGLPWEGPQYEDYLQRGGMITEPTALLGLNTGHLRLAGEAGPERLLSAAQTRAGGSYGMANIIIELDGEVLARAIAEPLVDEIRIRTGAHM